MAVTPGRDDQDHDHDDGRDRPAERRSLLLTLGTTTVILLAEAVGGWLTNSLALLADAGHMLSDALAIALAYFALVFATRPATPEKTYGWYRLEILAALVNGVTLVVISLFIFWEAWERTFDPPEVDVPTMLAIAVVGLAANALGLVFLRGHHHSLNLRGAYLHVLGDFMSSLGVIVGGVVMWLTGSYVVDPIISVFIGGVIVVGAYRLLRESVDVLMEATPLGIDYLEVAERIGDVEGVEGIHDLHIWSLTSGFHALSCHVEVKRENLPECDDILDRVRGVLRRAYGIDHTTIQIETVAYKRRAAVRWDLDDEGAGGR